MTYYLITKTDGSKVVISVSGQTENEIISMLQKIHIGCSWEIITKEKFDELNKKIREKYAI